MAVDPAYGNTSGYFKDPTNGEDLSVDTPRVIPCELKDGKFVWPQVAASDGSMLLKIVYKYFTEEEKELYKQYRGRASSGESKPRAPRVPRVQHAEKTVEGPSVTPVSERQVIKYDEESAISQSALDVLQECDTCYGISFICGITYALVGKRNDNVMHHIPRACIPEDIFNRLCAGAKCD